MSLKNNVILVILILFSTSILCQPKNTKSSPNDPQAEKLLSALKNKYEGLKAYAIAFEGTILNPEGKEVEKYKGKHVASGKKFNIKMNFLDIISNGSTTWNINHQSKSIQINSLTPNSKNNEYPLDIIFNYKKLYKYRIKETLSNNLIIVELIPLNKNNKLFKIDLTFNSKTQQISSSKLYEKSGARLLYIVSKTEFNPIVTENTFEIKPENYKNYEVLDLR